MCVCVCVYACVCVCTFTRVTINVKLFSIGKSSTNVISMCCRQEAQNVTPFSKREENSPHCHYESMLASASKYYW